MVALIANQRRFSPGDALKGALEDPLRALRRDESP
jgi:hypothetical protein